MAKKPAKTELDEIAIHMLEEAHSHDSLPVYSTTGSSVDNISILHQQVRCTNLAWALKRKDLIKPGQVVAIVGGSISGLMMAVLLSTQNRCTVYLFEENNSLLELHRKSAYRFIGPNLNSRDLPKSFDPLSSRPIYSPPVFHWHEGAASQVAYQWLHEFNDYYRKLPIFCFLSHKIHALSSRKNGAGVELFTSYKDSKDQYFNVDLVVIAQGFGREVNPHRIQDYSYWASGHPLLYTDHRKEKILISGCGDSGVVELMHYLFPSFSHSDFPRLYPSGALIESYIQPALEDSMFRSILFSPEVVRFDGTVISEICWFLQMKWQQVNWPISARTFSFYPELSEVYSLIKSHLTLMGVDTDFTYAEDTEDYFIEQIAALGHSRQMKIRSAIKKLVESFASNELSRIMGKIDPDQLIDHAVLGKYRNQVVSIHLNGLTPTPYTINLSPVNLWYMRLFTSFDNVEYIKGKIEKIRHIKRGYSVHYDDRYSEIYNHVVTRYGVRFESSLVTKPREKYIFGDWLLESPIIRLKTNRPNTSRVKDSAHDLAKRAVSLIKGRSVREGKLIDKHLFMAHLYHPQAAIGQYGKFSDPQEWLSTTIKTREKIRFTEDKSIFE